jgi:hypothetical protein
MPIHRVYLNHLCPACGGHPTVSPARDRVLCTLCDTVLSLCSVCRSPLEGERLKAGRVTCLRHNGVTRSQRRLSGAALAQATAELERIASLHWLERLAQRNDPRRPSGPVLERAWEIRQSRRDSGEE